MPLIKSAFRERVRELIGDPLRVSGTATGGSVSTIVDTTRLIQADGQWDGLTAFVLTTTNGLAPQGEDRKIERFTSSTKTLTLELPFSLTVEAGDTYGVAVFSNARIDNAVSGVLKEFSDYRPLKFSENLSVTVNEKRFAPTSASAIRNVSKVEYYSPGVEHTEYDFVWNRNTRKVEFENWFTTARVLTLYASKTHTLPAGDATALTYDDEDEDRLLRWCAARLMQNMAADEFRDNFGKLRLQSWTHGDVSEDFGNSRDQVFKQAEDVIAEIKRSFPSLKL